MQSFLSFAAMLLALSGIASCEMTTPQLPPPTDTVAKNTTYIQADSMPTAVAVETSETATPDTGITINTGKTRPDELVRFAETLIGIPYVWGSTDPQVGFDCSGFITYVFTHFNIGVPRSSLDFLYVGKTIRVEDARRGDLILFTGTDPMEAGIGHMGLVMANNASGLNFIHSTSGKAMAVTISPFNEPYRKRFVRIARIFM